MACASVATAEVARVDVSRREDVLSGRIYGDVGAYEWIQGRAHFTLDPLDKRNGDIVDLDRAPRNAQGRVEFSADVAIMRPKIAERASGVVVFDVVNRGRRAVLEYLNRGERGAAIGSDAFVGDDFLLKQGVTLVWLGWQQDLALQPGLMRMEGPVVAGIKGRVYGEFVISSRVMDVSLGDGTSLPYAAADVNDSQRQLAVSPSSALHPGPIPNEHWSFARMENGSRASDPMRVYVEGGFVPGAIYQFAYGTQNPKVAGLGFAGVRDLVSWIRHDAGALARGTYVYAFGAGQGGRFLRQFLLQGFNEDMAGRTVFDALMIHGAGASSRGFNERFAQPSRSTGARVFPFSDTEQTDTESGAKGGLLARALIRKVVPKIFYTSTSWDYWGSAASAIHTTVQGEDTAIPDTSRVYLLAASQPLPARTSLLANPETRGQLPHNPLDYRPALRALYAALDQWVRAGSEPPPSRHPKVVERSLVPRSRLNVSGFAGINVPRGTQPAVRLDFGEKQPGIPTIVPPKAGKPYVTLVPQVDDDGNELPGIRMPALTVPLATYTGWNLRAPTVGAPREMLSGVGGMRFFARTREERGVDPRPSVTERYGSRARYLERISAEAGGLVQQRLLLKEDVPHLVRDSEALWNAVMAESITPER